MKHATCNRLCRLALTCATICQMAVGEESGDEARNRQRLPHGAVARLGTHRFWHGGRVRSVAFSPDGRLIASVGSDPSIRIWDVRAGHEVHRLTAQDCERRIPFASLAYSRDGKWLATAGYDETLRIWSFETGAEKLIRRFKYDVGDVAFSPDSDTLATGQRDDGLWFWGVGAGTERTELRRPGENVSVVAYSGNGQVIAANTSWSTVTVWDAASGAERCQVRLPDFAEQVAAIALSPEGTMLATGSRDGIVHLYSTVECSISAELSCGTLEVTDLAFSPDGAFLAGSDVANGITVWAADTGEKVHEIVEGRRINDIEFSPDMSLLAVASAEIHLYDVETWNRTGPANAHEAPIRSLRFEGDDKLVHSLDSDGFEITWSIASQSEVGRSRRSAQARGRVLSADGEYVVRPGSQGAASVLKARSGERLMQLQLDQWTRINSLAADPVGHTFAVGGDFRRVWVYRRESEKPMFALSQHKVDVHCANCAMGKVALAFSPDGKTLASADRDIVLTDVETGETTRVFPKAGGHAVTFAPDGKKLAVGRHRTVRVLDIVSGKEIAVYHGHERYMTALVFSTDGKLLASASFDRLIYVWRTPQVGDAP